jgi:multisubunit Na+/H+ antiporter MnhF subunit
MEIEFLSIHVFMFFVYVLSGPSFDVRISNLDQLGVSIIFFLVLFK